LAPEIVNIPGGCFLMGSPADEKGRKDIERQHRVSVDDFKLGKYEVTVREFRRFVEATGYSMDERKSVCHDYDQANKVEHSNLSSWKSRLNTSKRQGNGLELPQACVSWNDVQAYIVWLNRETESRYRLPTEAEWEYAARGGKVSSRFLGDDPNQTCDYANVLDLSDSSYDLVGLLFPSIHKCNDGFKNIVSPVGERRKANGYGMSDMLRNLWEWTCSSCDKEYGGDEQRCTDKKYTGPRVIRGGAYNSLPDEVRAACGGLWDSPECLHNDIGFRLAQD